MPEKSIFGQNPTSFCMTTKTTKAQTTPATTPPQTDLTREIIHRRVKLAQERRRRKLKHVNP